MILYFSFFVVSILITIVINRLLLAFAKNLGIRGKELIQVRWATTSKPSLGGIAFYVTFIGIVSLIGIIGDKYIIISQKQMLGIFLCVSSGFAIGFADDTYNTNPLLKFIGQSGCGFLLYFFDIQIALLPDNEILNFLFTTFWVVAVMNSVNMLDNMDGVVSSVSVVIVSSFISILLLLNINDKNIIYIFLAIIGSLIGFLYHNWFPSKMYMGDAGSQFLGAFLAVFAIILLWNNNNLTGINENYMLKFNSLLISGLVFCVPIIDTLTVCYRRLRKGHSPFVGGSDHTTHHLVYFGLSERQVVYNLVILSGFSSFVALVFLSGYFKWSNTFSFIITIYLIALFAIMQYFYVKGSNRKNFVSKRNEDNKVERVSILNKYIVKSKSSI